MQNLVHYVWEFTFVKLAIASAVLIPLAGKCTGTIN